MGSGALCALGASAQEGFPLAGRQLRITVPFPPGAATDSTARFISQKAGELAQLGVVVENKTGASGNIAADQVAKQPADGYHLLCGAVSIVTAPVLYERAGYVPDQLTPVGVGTDSHLILVARASLAINNLKDMVAASAAASGGLNAASAGAGTLSHLGWEILRAETRVSFNHIPYRGSGPALTDVMGGQADVMIDSVVSAAPHIASGKLKALAVLTPKRLPGLPQVPTATEQGFASLQYSAWNAFFVPSQTPAAVVQALNVLLSRAVQHPEVSKALQERALDPVVMTPAAYLAFAQQEAQRWSRVIKAGNVKI